MSIDRAAELLAFIDASPSPWHAGVSIVRPLKDAGFTVLYEHEDWTLTPGGRYAVVRDGSTVAAFVVGAGSPAEHGFRIIAAHTDSPGFRVKPSGGRTRGEYACADVEIYGGPILATFTDRDLTLAGRVMVRDPADGVVRPRLFHAPDPIARIPTAAIHLNRQVNQDGLRLQQHDDLRLVLGRAAGESDPLRALLAETLECPVEAILAWELAVADTQPAAFFGAERAFIAAPRLDNLASCHAGLTALLDAAGDPFQGVSVLACFDHEEVGSESFKGAQGSFLPELLARISDGLATGDHRRALARSMVVSADMTHGYHPVYPALYDENNAARINDGPAIKINAQQRYATDAAAEAVFQALCQEADVPCQRYVHRNDIPCGTTIGPLTGAATGIRTVDVGNPMWSMHSIRESAGARDHAMMIRVMTHFLQRSQLPWSEAV